MKRFVCIFLAVVIVVCLYGCAKQEPIRAKDSLSSKTQTEEKVPESAIVIPETITSLCDALKIAADSEGTISIGTPASKDRYFVIPIGTYNATVYLCDDGKSISSISILVFKGRDYDSKDIKAIITILISAIEGVSSEDAKLAMQEIADSFDGTSDSNPFRGNNAKYQIEYFYSDSFTINAYYPDGAETYEPKDFPERSNDFISSELNIGEPVMLDGTVVAERQDAFLNYIDLLSGGHLYCAAYSKRLSGDIEINKEYIFYGYVAGSLAGTVSFNADLYDGWIRIAGFESVIGTESLASDTETVEQTQEQIVVGDFGKTIAFEGFEITITDAYIFTTVNNRYNDHNGDSVIELPVHIKNTNEESGHIDIFHYKFFGSKGIELDSVEAFFDNDIFRAGDLRPGAEYDTFFHLLYDGDGTYCVEFKNYNEKIELVFYIVQPK